jgi:hypothetical protein
MKKIMLLIKQIISNKMLTNNKNYDIINYNKGENTMSKIKQYIETSVENQVDQILKSLKGGNIDEVKAEKEILGIDNLAMVGIDENNVGEVIYEAING